MDEVSMRGVLSGAEDSLPDAYPADSPEVEEALKPFDPSSRTRSFPDLFQLESDAVHGTEDWATDEWEMPQTRKMEILLRYDPPQTEMFTVERNRKTRTWRGADLKALRQLRKARRNSMVYSSGAPEKKKNRPWWHPSRPAFRWIVLVFAALMTFSDVIQFDGIGALSVVLQQAPFKLLPTQIGMLDGLYSIPNCVLVAFGGVLIDKIGIRKATTLFALSVFVSSGVAAIAVQFSSFWALAVARVVLSLGGDCMYVAQDAFIAQWFSGRNLAFAMSMSTVIARSGDIFAYSGLPALANNESIGLQATFWVVAGISAFCFLCCLAAMVLDRVADGYVADWEDDEPEVFSFRDIRYFGGGYWFAVGIVVCFYGCVLPFQQFASIIFNEQYSLTPTEAGVLTSIISITSLVMSPLLAIFCDRFGHRIHACMVATMLLIAAFIVMRFPWITPIVPMALIGISFSLVPAALWPCLSILVDPKYFGTAYGMMEAGINIVNTALYYGISPLLDEKRVYDVLAVWLALACASLILCILWMIQDRRTGGLCSLPSADTVELGEDELVATGTKPDVPPAAPSQEHAESAPLLV